MRRRILAAVTLAAAITLGGSGTALADPGPDAVGAAVNSPGIASGNVIQVPVHVPVNACGNTISVVGLLNPTFGNYCVNR